MNSTGIHNEPPAEIGNPVSAEARVKTIDIIRGVALLGILMMNIPGFGVVWSTEYFMQRGPRAGADFHTWESISIFFEGTMRGLFSMLFGAGMILFVLNKKEQPGSTPVIELYYRRLLWLVIFGVFNAFVLQWFGDILYYYGLCGMVLYPFRKLVAKYLLLLGVVFICMGAFKSSLRYDDMRDLRKNYLEAKKAEKEKKKLTEEQQGALNGWPEREKWKPDSVVVKYEIEKFRHGSYPEIFTHTVGWNSSGESWGMYHYWIWDCLAMMFIGMGLFQLGFFLQ